MNTHSFSIVLIIQSIILFVSSIDDCCSQRLHPTSGCMLGVSVGTRLDFNQKNYVSYSDLYYGTGKKIIISNIFIGFPSRWSGPLAFDAFPEAIVRDVRSANPNAIMMFTLEPWENFSDFYGNWLTGNPAYDATMEFAQACKRYNKKVFIRFAHEMNGNWYHWGRDSVSSQDYITAFRNVSKAFHEVCDSVAMIWCPNYASDEKFRKYSEWWPCDEYVDWVGIDYYNWIDSAGASPDDYQLRDALLKDGFYNEFCSDANPTGHRKPLMICETAAEFRPILLLDSVRIIDGFEKMNIGGGGDYDWWEPWPNDGSFSVTQVIDDAVSGNSVMKMNGNTKEGSNYIGGTGRGINWSDTGAVWDSSTGISIWLKRAKDENANPIIRITFLDIERHTESDSLDGGWCEISLDTCESGWREFVIPFAAFSDTAYMTLSRIRAMKLHLKVKSGETRNPSAVYIDSLQRGTVSKVINNDDNITWKRDWIDQLLSTQSNDVVPPKYVSIKEEFPNLHAVCWFNVEKSENCALKDFRIPQELWTYVKQKTDNEYFSYGDTPIEFMDTEKRNEKRIRIDACFPNPSQTNVTLICSVDNPSSGNVKLYDVLGRIVYSKDVQFCCREGNILEIGGENRPSGLYMCVVTVGSEKESRGVYWIK